MLENITDRGQRGPLLAIGGAEDKKGARRLLTHFCQVCGGAQARIAIIASASSLPDTAQVYARLFHEISGAQAILPPAHDRQAASEQAAADLLEQATGIFLTGGNQLKLINLLGGTALGQAIRRANSRGVPVAGTSAGASAISGHMIEAGYSGHVPRYGMVRFAPGLGLSNRVIIDQHFSVRRRLGRLITAVATNPYLIGLGIDEDTAAVISADNVVSILGQSSVTIVDGSGISHTNLHELRSRQPASIVGVTLHVLTEGWHYNLQKREAFRNENPRDAGVSRSQFLELPPVDQYDG